MKQHVIRQISFLRTTAIGGIFFLLPVVVIVVLLGQVGQGVYHVAVAIQPLLQRFGLSDAWGFAVVFAIAILLILLACFVAGLFARGSLAKSILTWVEKYLVMLFPRYAIFKEQLSGNIGGNISRNVLRPVRVRLDDYTQVAFEVERSLPSESAGELAPAESASCDSELVTVFVPGSPDPWNGRVMIVSSDRIAQIDAPVPDVLGAFEKLGQDTQKLLAVARIRPGV